MLCCVTAVQSMRNQSWMQNLLFSASQDSILDSNLDSLLSILNSRRNPESWIKSRIETHCTDCKPTFKRYRKIAALKKLPILLLNLIPFPVFVLDDAPTLMGYLCTSGVSSSNKSSTCPLAGAPPEEIYTCQGFWYYAMCMQFCTCSWSYI